jgi:hypothetical protein
MTLRGTVIAMTLSGATVWAAMAQTAAPPTHGHHHPAAAAAAGAVPQQPGQDAFGAIQEVVAILEADPATDWSRVNVDALREHLVDMNELTLRARIEPRPIEGGLRMEVSGEGPTLAAIQRMVPAHAREIDGRRGWTVNAEPSRSGVVLTVTSRDPAEVARIRGLGFFGIMSVGSHHQRHHLAIARGEPMHGEPHH